MKAGIQKYTYCFFTCVLVVLGTVDIIWKSLQMKETFLLPLLLAVVVLMICIVDCYKRNPILYAIVISFLLLFFYVLWRINASFFSVIGAYYQWFTKNRIQNADTSFVYLAVTIVLLGLAIGIPCYILLKNHYARELISVISFVLLIVFGMTGHDTSKRTVACYITYCFLVIIELAFRMYYKNQSNKSKDVITSLIPLLLIILALLFFLPTKENPMEWKYVKKLWKGITYTVKEMKANIKLLVEPDTAEFSVNFTGYSETGELIGGLEVSNEEVLQVKVNHSVQGAFYLRGNAKDTYYGTGWKNSGNRFKNAYHLTEQQMEILELYYALERAGIRNDDDERYSYITSRDIDITLGDIFTNTVFLPAKTSYISKEGSFRYVEENGNIKFKKLYGAGTTYNVRYVDFNLNSDKFLELIKNQSGYDYGKEETKEDTTFVNHLLNSTFHTRENMNTDLNEFMQSYIDYIRKTYGTLPESLPQRVITLSQEVTKNASSDFEKCKVIEAFLKSYTYTLTPKYEKGFKDAVDCFLFEEKEGYCTYFATAFAIMARSVGIPTRYVQGFYVSEDEKTGNGIYRVTQADSHAWVEAYIQGIGWLPFEATPSFQEDSYVPWKERNKGVGEGNNMPYYQENYYEEIMSKNVNDMLQDLQLEEEDKKDYSLMISIILLFFLLVLLCIGMYLVILNRIQKRQYRLAGRNGQIRIEMEQLLRMLDVLSYHRSVDETLIEYFSRIRPSSYLMEAKVDSLINSYMKVRYHEENVDEQQIKEFQDMKRYLLNQMKKTMQRMKYVRKRVQFYLVGIS